MPIIVLRCILLCLLVSSVVSSGNPCSNTALCGSDENTASRGISTATSSVGPSDEKRQIS